MRKSLKITYFIWFIIFTAVVIHSNSCARISIGQERQDTSYFAPTYRGKDIFCLRQTLGPPYDLYAAHTYDYLVRVGETTVEDSALFEANFGTNTVQIDLSSSGTYLSVLGQWTDTFEVTHYNVNVCTPETRFSSFDLNGGRPTSLHFSPDESKIAVSYGNDKFVITDLQGQGTKECALGGSFIWKNNNEGFFYKKDSSELALINLNTDFVTPYGADIVPLTYNATDEVIYSLSGCTFESYALGGAEVVKKQLNFDPIKYIRPHISADGKNVVMCITPYTPPGGTSYEAGGVYLINVEENVLKKIRYYSNEKIIP